MQEIRATIDVGAPGPLVVNLQDGLLLLLKRKVIRDRQPPDQPTAEELARLARELLTERAKSTFGSATQRLVHLVQLQEGLGDNLGGRVDDRTASVLNELLMPLGGFDNQDALSVSGTVLTPDQHPGRGVKVHAFDRDLRTEQGLGTDTTDDAGQYLIRYTRGQFATADKPGTSAPYLIVRFFVGDLQVGDDVVRPRPARDEVVDFALPGQAQSEWERLCIGLFPLLAGQGDLGTDLPPADVTDHDLDFLVEESGFERERVQLWALAFARVAQSGQLDPEPSILPEAYFGWFRRGQPWALDDLLAVHDEPLRDALEASKLGSVIPEAVDTASALAAVDALRIAATLRDAPEGERASLGQLLATLPQPLPLEQQRALASATLNADDPHLVSRIAGLRGFDGDAAAVARTIRLGALSDGHLPLITALHPLLDSEAEGSLRPLAALRPDQWLDLAHEYGTPAGSDLDADGYASELAFRVEREHPTAALAAHLDENRQLGNISAAQPAAAYLTEHPEFDIVTENLDVLLDAADADDNELLRAQVSGLKSLQRLNTLGITWDEAATLWQVGISSPHHVLSAGPGQLCDVLGDQISDERVLVLHEQAEQLQTFAIGALTAALSSLAGPSVLGGWTPPDPGNVDPIEPGGTIELPSLTDILSKGKAVDPRKALLPRGVPKPPPGKRPRSGEKTPFFGGTIDHFPTLRGLFGDQDSCSCDDCSSVLSPAAYFVDLLQYIKNAHLDGLLLGAPAWDGRRPDLQDLELSCTNTHTVVPSIDLVLETLENAVALSLQVELPPGTDIEAQLAGATVGTAVRDALSRTVRSLSAAVSATREGAAWTVVDGHRRWTLTARAEDSLRVAGPSESAALQVSRAELPAVVTSLDAGVIRIGTESAFAAMLSPALARPAPLTNYRVTVTPRLAGHSWRIDYQFTCTLSISDHDVTMNDSAGVVWMQRGYKPKTILAMLESLRQGAVPALIRGLVADHIGDRGTLSVTAAADTNVWTVQAAPRQLVLNFHPAVLTISSLAYQSGDPGADAVAEPENHNPEAYARLAGADAVFPWTLPVDLPWEATTLYLNRAGCSRRRWLELTAPSGQPVGTVPAFVHDVLGFSAAESDLIGQATTPSNADIYRYWGLSATAAQIFDTSTGKNVTAANPLALLQNVSILLQQARLEFEDLQALLATRFVSHEGPVVITPRTTCKPSEMTAVGLTTRHLDRLHRFIRLQRRLAWPVKDLDAAIPAGDPLNEITLQRFAQLQILSQLLELPAAQVITWYDATLNPGDSHAALARALMLPTDEIEHAVQLFGIVDPLATPAVTAEFCRRVRRDQRGGVSFEDLRFLLQHHQTPGSAIGLDEHQLSAAVSAIRTAARSIPDSDDPAATDATTTARENAVIAAATLVVAGDRDLVDELLRHRLRDPANPAQPALTACLATVFVSGTGAPALAADGAVHDLVARLDKMLRICAILELGLADLLLVRTSQQDRHGFEALDVNSLPVQAGAAPAAVADFERLVALAGLRHLTPRARQAADLLHAYAGVDLADDMTTPAAAELVIATGLGMSAPDVAAAADLLGLNSTAAYRDPSQLGRLIELVVALKQQGATVVQAQSFVVATPDDSVAMGARALLRAKNDPSRWHDVVKPISDALRARQRDALVDYLVNRDQLRGADDLYARYLIDVQISSCLETTRLLLATAALQLFVQRVLLNLERGLTLSADKRELWDWMRSYRVWEANRKVFLWPENWLLPELRDDRTRTFEAMESTLGEREPTAETALDAVRTYLDDLAELAQITVVAMFEDRRMIDEAGHQVERRVLYVVGRTPNQPYRYYWRSCTQFGDPGMWWTGWEGLDLDHANDFIMPFVFDGDLHLAWPLFEQTTNPKNEDDTRWKVQLAWSRRTSRGWTKRKIGDQRIDAPRPLNKTAEQSFAFRLIHTGQPVTLIKDLDIESVQIDCYAAEPEIADPPPVLEPVIPPGAVHFGNSVTWWVNTTLTLFPQVYGHYKTGSPKVDKWEHLSDATVTVKYRYGYWGGDYDEKSVQISSTAPTTLTVQNAREVKVTISRGAQTYDVSTTLKDSADNSEYSLWNWRPTHVFELSESAHGDFNPDRPVIHKKAGWFTLNAVYDISATSIGPGAVLDNQGVLAGKPAGNTIELDIPNGQLPLPPGSATLIDAPDAAVILTKANQLSVTDRSIWYAHDHTYRYYLQARPGELTLWPDGQEFASWYRTLAKASLPMLFDPGTQATRRDGKPSTVPSVPATRMATSSPAISFDRSAPYANYNWELFLHLPLAIASHQAAHQRYDDARRTLQAVFDPPTDRVNPVSRVPQFWRFLPFHNDSQPASIAQMLTWLADPSSSKPGDPAFEMQFAAQIEEWKRNPFMPHVVARLRPSSYQWYAFFSYLDVLIAAGDQQFRRDTRESVNEATLLYTLVAKLLGPRPRTLEPPDPQPPALTYRSLPKDRHGDLDAFSNAWVDYADLPGVKQLQKSATTTTWRPGTTPQAGSSQHSAASPWGGLVLSSLSALAFCVPQNSKIADYHDLIEKRLFNVRNCRNIDGVFRDLPLYEPAIDPLLLIRARAAGLDLSSVVADTYAPLPNHRFVVVHQKASELCAELKNLGAGLLSALEKKDAERLTILRSTQELALLAIAGDIRQQQIDEADANMVALQRSRDTVLTRFSQYQKLLGKTTVSRGSDGLPVVEQSSTLAVATDAPGDLSGLGLSRREVDQLTHTAAANAFTQVANATNILASIFNLIPNITAGSPFFGQTFGGTNIGAATSAIAKAIEMGTVQSNFLAGQAGTFASYERRQDEWVHQSRLALAELAQIEQQIVAAEIRKAIAQNEFEQHQLQVTHAQDVSDFLHDKFTSQQLYSWLSSQLAEVYFSTYQLALDQARRAERAYRHELGIGPDASAFVRGGQWDTLKRGLLVGEQLHHDLWRMESAYLDRNVRERELTKHISIRQISPAALLRLRETGSCDFDLPEALFDLDLPGHYLRRIKMVSLSIPCVVGPYASVNATLTLTKNQIRVSLSAEGTYGRTGIDDSRFRETHAAINAIVTSSAQQDSGMFEPGLRDERYLPFEGAGAVSSWTLDLPKNWHSFDYSTIADVVLHLRYTARDGGEALRDKAVAAVNTLLSQVTQAGLTRMVSLREEFPSQWGRFLNPPDTDAGQHLSFALGQDRFNLGFQNRTVHIQSADVLLVLSDAADKAAFHLDPARPTALGDYLAEAPLELSVVPPGAAPVMKATPVPDVPWPPVTRLDGDDTLDGLPHAAQNFARDYDGARTPGTWTVTFADEDLEAIAPSLRIVVQAGGQDHWRFKPELVRDVVILLQYTLD